MKPVQILALIALVSLSTSCSFFKVIADVSSNTSWTGNFDGKTVSATGDMKVDMGARSGKKCAVVIKDTRQGFLTVSVSGGESKTTTADFGLVSACE